MARENPSRNNPRGTPDRPEDRQTAPSRGSRARSTRTASPPAPNVPQPLVRLLLVAVFVVTAWAVFSQVHQKDNEGEVEAEATQGAVSKPSTASLPPSLRMVGTWRYILGDAESARRAEAQDSVDAGADDAISRVMLRQLDLRLKDQLEVTQTGLTLTRGDHTESGSWEAIEEGDDNLTFVFTTTDKVEVQAQVTFTGGDWLSLVLGAQEDAETLRWRRVKPALPRVPTPAQTPAEESP